MKCLGPHKKQVPDCLEKHKSTRFEIYESFRRHLVPACPCCCIILGVASCCSPKIDSKKNTSTLDDSLKVTLRSDSENREKNHEKTISPVMKNDGKEHIFLRSLPVPKPMVQPRWPFNCRGLSMSDPAKFRHSIDGSHARQRIKVLGVQHQGLF